MKGRTNKRGDKMLEKEFKGLLKKEGERKGFQWEKYKIGKSPNVIELSGSINCLLYFKLRSKPQFRWGISENIIEGMRNSGKPWFIVLFYESSNTGYLLTADDVKHYREEKIWHLAEGDYKVGIGKDLSNNTPFSTFEDFINSLQNPSTYKQSLSDTPDMGHEEYPPNKVTTTVTRVIRDTVLSNKVKEERNYKCQVCNTTLIIKGNGYAETHHLKPLGHAGFDIESNMLVLCPNHHVLFDYGEIAISPDDNKTVIDSKGDKIAVLRTPLPEKKYLEYHYNNIYKIKKYLTF